VSARAGQRRQTRERIVSAALKRFSDGGFRGTSTREIARVAGTTQGLVTYHFKTKDALWRAAADRIFGQLRTSLTDHIRGEHDRPVRERARAAIRAYVRFAAAHPELFRLLIEEGDSDDERMEWLADNHIRDMYRVFRPLAVDATGDETLAPHLFYTLAGAASLMFAVAPECRRVTGLDPAREEAVERHADLVAGLMVP
jgi:AcrR family transcriptional regulator